MDSTDIPYRCPRCGNHEQFTSLSELKLHLRNEHSYQSRELTRTQIFNYDSKDGSSSRARQSNTDAQHLKQLPADKKVTEFLQRLQNRKGDNLNEAITTLNNDVQRARHVQWDTADLLHKTHGMLADIQTASERKSKEEREVMGKLQVEVKSKDEQLAKANKEISNLRGEKEKLYRETADLSRKVHDFDIKTSNLQKQLKQSEQQLKQKEKELQNFKRFLKSAAQKEAVARKKLKLFIDKLIERADKAELELRQMKSQPRTQQWSRYSAVRGKNLWKGVLQNSNVVRQQEKIQGKNGLGKKSPHESQTEIQQTNQNTPLYVNSAYEDFDIDEAMSPVYQSSDLENILIQQQDDDENFQINQSKGIPKDEKQYNSPSRNETPALVRSAKPPSESVYHTYSKNFPLTTGSSHVGETKRQLSQPRPSEASTRLPKPIKVNSQRTSQIQPALKSKLKKAAAVASIGAKTSRNQNKTASSARQNYDKIISERRQLQATPSHPEAAVTINLPEQSDLQMDENGIVWDSPVQSMQGVDAHQLTSSAIDSSSEQTAADNSDKLALVSEHKGGNNSKELPLYEKNADNHLSTENYAIINEDRSEMMNPEYQTQDQQVKLNISNMKSKLTTKFPENHRSTNAAGSGGSTGIQDDVVAKGNEASEIEVNELKEQPLVRSLFVANSKKSGQPENNEEFCDDVYKEIERVEEKLSAQQMVRSSFVANSKKTSQPIGDDANKETESVEEKLKKQQMAKSSVLANSKKSSQPIGDDANKETESVEELKKQQMAKSSVVANSKKSSQPIGDDANKKTESVEEKLKKQQMAKSSVVANSKKSSQPIGDDANKETEGVEELKKQQMAKSSVVANSKKSSQPIGDDANKKTESVEEKLKKQQMAKSSVVANSKKSSQPIGDDANKETESVEELKKQQMAKSSVVANSKKSNEVSDDANKKSETKSQLNNTEFKTMTLKKSGESENENSKHQEFNKFEPENNKMKLSTTSLVLKKDSKVSDQPEESLDTIQQQKVWLSIFGYLDKKTLSHLALVCKEWKKLSRHPDLWCHVVLSHSRISSKYLETISNWCTQVQSLTLEDLQGRPRKKDENEQDYEQCIRGSLETGLEMLLKSSEGTLQYLRIYQCGSLLTQRCLWTISCYGRLLKYLCYRSNTDPAGAEVLWALGGGCLDIVSLHLGPLFPCEKPEQFNNKCLQVIAKFYSTLEELCISGPHIDANGLNNLAKGCQNLRRLEMDHLPEISESTAKSMCKDGLKNLEQLTFHFTPVAPNAVLLFKQSCKELRKISINIDISSYFQDVTDSKNKQKYRLTVGKLRSLTKHPGLSSVLKLEAEDI